MKRVIAAVLGTIAGLVGLLSFKSHGAVSTASGLPSASLPTSSSTTSGAGSTIGTGSTSAAGSPASSSNAPSASAATPTSSVASSSASYVGSAVQTRYGVVQVKITVTGSRITDVAFVQLTAFDGHSADINSQAGPILLQQTLSAQSAQIDGVSGATYTTDGYEQSLQSALDKAGIK